MYLQYNHFSIKKKTSASLVCALHWTAAHLIKKLFRFGSEHLCLQANSGKALTRDKNIWSSSFKCRWFTAIHRASDTSSPEIKFRLLFTEYSIYLRLSNLTLFGDVC